MLSGWSWFSFVSGLAVGLILVWLTALYYEYQQHKRRGLL